MQADDSATMQFQLPTTINKKLQTTESTDGASPQTPATTTYFENVRKDTVKKVEFDYENSQGLLVEVPFEFMSTEKRASTTLKYCTQDFFSYPTKVAVSLQLSLTLLGNFVPKPQNVVRLIPTTNSSPLIFFPPPIRPFFFVHFLKSPRDVVNEDFEGNSSVMKQLHQHGNVFYLEFRFSSILPSVEFRFQFRQFAKSKKPTTIEHQTKEMESSQHKRKLMTMELDSTMPSSHIFFFSFRNSFFFFFHSRNTNNIARVRRCTSENEEIRFFEVRKNARHSLATSLFRPLRCERCCHSPRHPSCCH
jgi:hypothetical protein